MTIDVNPIKSAINSVLMGQHITPQVNVSGSQLTVVLNRRNGYSAEYENLSQKIVTALINIDIPDLDVIKFYGKGNLGRNLSGSLPSLSSRRILRGIHSHTLTRNLSQCLRLHPETIPK